jgi:hypothetical protein
MTCRFLDTLTLDTLVSPVTGAQFRANYWERRPLIVHRGDPDYYGNLMTLQDFDHAITTTPAYIKTAEAKSKKNAKYEGDPTSVLERTFADMRGGATLVLDSLHQREPKLGLLCRILEQQFGHGFQTNLYLTPPNGQGFEPHWDNHDVFILQVMGSKHWKVERKRRLLPGKTESSVEEEIGAISDDAHSFTLNQGDLIYIPRGCVHAAESGSEPSLHITLGIRPITWDDLLFVAIKALVRGDDRFRAMLPIGFLQGDKDVLVNGLLFALGKASDKAFLGGVVDQYRNELVAKFPLDVSGQVTNFFQGIELGTKDTVGARRGIVYRLHTADECVHVIFGGRNIIFPDVYGEALNFALKTSAFKMSDLPGEMDDEERLSFVERLMQEGLVVRV